MNQPPPPRPWHRRGPRLPTLLLLGFVAFALIGCVMLVWQTITTERTQRAQAMRTNAVLLALRDVSRTAVNAETGHRGYFITLDRRYLAPYLVAQQQYRAKMETLRDLMGPDISERQRVLLDQIEMLNEAKFAELSESVTAIQSGALLDARRRILTDEGQDVMERLRRAVASLEFIELGALNAARREAEASEARILPMLLILLVMIVLALGLGLAQIIRAADAEAQAANARELALARDRADLLARELNHRVKNLFAVVLAIVKMTGRNAPEAKPTVDRIADRVHALLNAHEVTQGNSAHRSAHLTDLVETALRPYRSEESQCTYEGPAVTLPDRAVVPLGLVLHELTTNAVKYGGWARAGGRIDISWSVTPEDRLEFEWRETVIPTGGEEAARDPGKKGFGTTLIDGSAKQLGGSIDRRYGPTGIAVRIEFPLGA